MRSSLVYKFSCSRCESAYVGSTTRALLTRVSEHKGVSCRTGRMLSTPPHSNIRDHVYSCNSPLTIDNFNILNFCNNSSDLRILESLYIHKIKPSLNSRTWRDGHRRFHDGDGVNIGPSDELHFSDGNKLFIADGFKSDGAIGDEAQKYHRR